MTYYAQLMTFPYIKSQADYPITLQTDFLQNGIYYCFNNQVTKTEVEEVKIHPEGGDTLKCEISHPIHQKFNMTEEDLIKYSPRKKRQWSEEQDRLLLGLLSEGKISHQELQNYFPNLTKKEYDQRFKRIQLEWRRRRWSKEEDQLLVECQKQYGSCWKMFVPHFDDRTSKQIRERYMNYLRPNIMKADWSREEDLLLCKLLVMHGKKWKLFESHLIGRSENIIKNRYYGFLKKIYEKREREIKRVQRKLKYAFKKRCLLKKEHSE